MCKHFKSVISFALIFVMLLGMVPQAVYAGLLDNTPEVNEAILEDLEKALGNNEDAEAYYDILEQYGLLDDDGNLLQNVSIVTGGKSYSLLQLRSLLAQDFDEDQLAYVDGTPITLGNLKTILDIEDYISYVRENYVFPEDWTQEQKDNFSSWLTALENGNVSLTVQKNDALKGNYSGVNHGAMVSFSTGTVSNTSKGGIVFAQLSGAEEGQTVTFEYAFISATAKSADSTFKTATLVADSEGKAECTLSFTTETLTIDELYTDGLPLLYLQARNITNGLFANNETATTHAIKMEPTVSEELNFAPPENFNLYLSHDLVLNPTIAQNNATDYYNTKKANGNLPDIDVTLTYYPTVLSKASDYAIRRGWLTDFTTADFIYWGYWEYEEINEMDYLSIYAYVGPDDNPTGVVDLLIDTLDNRNGRLYQCNTYSNRSRTWINSEIYATEPKVTLKLSYWNFIKPEKAASSHYNPQNLEVRMVFYDNAGPSASAAVPETAYADGQNIPLIMTYSEPVKIDTASVVINGNTIYPEEKNMTGASQATALTFLYPAAKLYEEESLIISAATATDLAGHSLNWSEQILENIEVQPMNKIRSFTESSGTLDNTDPAKPVLDINLSISDNIALVQWLASDLDDKGVSKTLSAAISESEKAPFKLTTDNIPGGTLTAAIPLTRGDEDRSCTIELYDEDKLIIQYLESFTLDKFKYITESSISTSMVVKNSEGGFYICDDPENPVIYVQDAPIIRAGFELDATDYTYGDITNVTCFDGDELENAGAFFAWKSSDPSVALIDESGQVTPTGKAGTVHFILYAFNDTSAEKTIVKETESITFGVGLTPFLVMPRGSRTAESGSDLNIYWSSNIPDKQVGTLFTVTVKCGDETVYETQTTGFTAKIPGEVLCYNYDAPSKNLLSISVSANYLEKEFCATGSIKLISQPAQVALSRPDSYYMTDSTDSVSISYLVSGFDASVAGNSGTFELRVTRNSDLVLELTNPGTGSNGTYSDTLDIAISDVAASTNNPTSYRDVYTVTLQARNGTDSTWSCDSYVFYVYDTDAMKLMFDGEEAGDTATVSNIPAISSMSQEEIIALKRAITLDSTISINYKDYAWTDISDRMTWKSSDSDVAEIRYQYGSLNENIENTDYTSFLPITEFDLTGIKEGKTDISVTHMLTGMSAGATVTVETLKDKLYLFSFVPAAATTITYTNGKGEECTITSDSNGQAAIYEESGISGDLYLTSNLYGLVDYAGTLSSSVLVSGEGETIGSSLYPCNNFTLRRTAYAYMYLKDTDGTPYTKSVILRGGVYLNGSYLPDALFGIGDRAAANKRGDSDIIVTPDSSGRIAITMDRTQWGIEGGQPKMSDEIEYVFEITPSSETDYYPIIVNVDAKLDACDYIYAGESIVNMRKNSGTGKEPFIFRQEIELRNLDNGIYETENLLDSTECTGISDVIPESTLTLGIMWWNLNSDITISGSLDAPAGKSVGSFDGVAASEVYPFFHSSITFLSFDIDEEVAKNADIGASPVSLRLNWTQSDGVKISRDLSFTFASSAGQAENISSTGNEKVEQAVESLRKLNTDVPLKIDDNFVKYMLELIASDDYTGLDKDSFALQFVGTKDPHVFYLFMSIGLGTMSSSNVNGTYAIDQNNSSKGKFGCGPGWSEVKLLFHRDLSKYKDELDSAIEKTQDGDWTLGFDWKFSGYLQLKMTASDTYNQYSYGIDGSHSIQYDRWESEIVSGGFNGGFGIKFTKYINTSVGPVPVTVEFRIGGSVELSFDALTMQYILEDGTIDKGNEFLTQLRFYLYGYAFGGLGFDYSVVALKIGAFGQLSLDITAKWLNREYFYDDVKDVYYYDGEKIANTDGKLNGQNLRIDGQVGISFKAKVWLASYEKVLVSLPFNALNNKYNDWKTIGDIWDASQDKSKTYINSLMKTSTAPLMSSSGIPYTSIDFLPTAEDFAYLESGGRSWNGLTLMGAASNNKDFTVIQSNAYPFSQPEVSEDGELMVYLSDSDGKTGSIQTAYAVKNGSGYTEKGLISEDSLEDAGCCVAGTEDFAVAAWYSLGTGTTKDAGTVITPEEQMIMLEGCEVSAAVYEGGKWNTTTLTDNSGADIAPVVAVSGDRAIVAWRSVATSHLNGNIVDFDLKDEIHYRVYENGQWSEEATLYNGTNGNVKGLNAAMLTDGTAAVVYCLDKDNDDSTSSDREIQWTIIGADGNAKRTVQASADSVADENPQITTAEINGIERFVAAWNSQQNDNHDVRLADFDAGGVMTLCLPQTVASATSDSSTVISSNFRFVKGADKLGDLALIWSETNEDESGETYPGDSLKAVRFYTRSNGTIGVSAPQTLVDADDSTSIDNLDAYTDNGTIYALSLCTQYNTNKLVKVSGETQSGETVSAYVADSTSFMASAVGSFGSEISVESVDFDQDGLKCGKDTLTEFTIKNTGADAIEKLEISLGGNVTVIDNIELVSGQTGVYYADYTVPSDTLRDESYSVKAYGADSGIVSASGTVPFGRTCVRIISAGVAQEGDGKRTVEVKLCETTDYALKNSGSKVEIRFCSDASGEDVLKKITVKDNDSLSMIDEGGYCLRQVFDMSDFADQDSGELPYGGADIYVFVDVLHGSGESINMGGEKSAIVTMESLVEETGKEVSISTEFRAESGRSQVSVSVRNNYLSETKTGNLIVSLLDESGAIIAQKQNYDPDAKDYGLVTLCGEETADMDFSFDVAGASVDVQFGSFEAPTEAATDDNTELALFAVAEMPAVSIGNFVVNDGGIYRAEASADVSNISFVIMPKSVNATVSYKGDVIDGGITLNAGAGINVYTFCVTSGSGNSSAFYTLVLHNNKGSIGSVTTSDAEASVFVDVKESDYFYEAVQWAAANGITSGVDGTHFNPLGAVTRGQMVTFLWNAAGQPEPVITQCNFTDLDPTAYYYKAVLWAVENKYTAGVSADKFAPELQLSRGQAITFLWNFEGCIKLDDMTTEDLTSSFDDVGTDAYYYYAVLWAKANGITAGISATRFSPDDTCVRAQVVTFLFKDMVK